MEEETGLGFKTLTLLLPPLLAVGRKGRASGGGRTSGANWNISSNTPEGEIIYIGQFWTEEIHDHQLQGMELDSIKLRNCYRSISLESRWMLSNSNPLIISQSFIFSSNKLTCM